MKTFKYLKSLAIAVAFVAISLAFSDNANAQKAYKPYFGNVDWQFNAPFNNDFTNRASGWGASFEGGIYVTPKIGLGLFVSYSSNHKEIPTKTLYPNASSALTAEQERSLFQVPFGINARYRFYSNSDVCDPYIGMKLGTSYTQLSSYMSTFRVYDDSWGFYMSPEIGTNLWLSSEKTFGFNMSLYYSFSTNSSRVLDGHINQLNNMGFRVGIAF
jgi:hypothetical protein